jgi:hypothetical protein
MKSQASKYFTALKNSQKLGNDICFLNKLLRGIPQEFCHHCFFLQENLLTAIKILLVGKSILVILNKGLLELVFRIL